MTIGHSTSLISKTLNWGTRTPMQRLSHSSKHSYINHIELCCAVQ
ncbi:MAG TPA: hypothetical protein V6D10_24580 [Trichocoleus sp.]